MTIISCTGFGTSGSSAATNFFEEFSTVKTIPHEFECTFLHEPDGLIDLGNQICNEGHRLKVDAAINRFLNLTKRLNNGQYKKYFNNKFEDYTNSFINNTITCKWNGFWHSSEEFRPFTRKQKIRFDYISKLYTQQKKTAYDLYEQDSWQPTYQPFNTMYYENDKEKFLCNAKKYVNSLMCELNTEKAPFLLVDQLTPPINFSTYDKYFDNLKCIVVDRDPRDLYICNKVYWGERYIPSHDINIFIEWYKKTREIKTTEKNKNLVFIFFEDMIYDYEKTSEKLISFVGLKETNHIKRQQIFNPSLSKRNTKTWLKHSEYIDDIRRIENELSNFLYNYPTSELIYEAKKNNKNNSIDYLFSNLDSIQSKKITIKDRGSFAFLTFLRFPKRLLTAIKSLKKSNFLVGLFKTFFYLLTLPIFILVFFIKAIIKGILL